MKANIFLVLICFMFSLQMKAENPRVAKRRRLSTPGLQRAFSASQLEEEDDKQPARPAAYFSITHQANKTAKEIGSAAQNVSNTAGYVGSAANQIGGSANYYAGQASHEISPSLTQ